MKGYIGFVGGDTAIDEVIQFATGSEYLNITHVFLPFPDGIIEAEGVKQYGDKYPGVWKHPLSKYQDNKNVRIVEVDIPDYQAYWDYAESLKGIPYGKEDCAAAEVYLASKGRVTISNGIETLNCSETGTRCLRIGGVDVEPELQIAADKAKHEIAADVVNPVQVYLDLIRNHGGHEVTWQTMIQALQAQAA